MVEISSVDIVVLPLPLLLPASVVELESLSVSEAEDVVMVPEEAESSESPSQLTLESPNRRPKPAARTGFAATPHSGGPQNGQCGSSG